LIFGNQRITHLTQSNNFDHHIKISSPSSNLVNQVQNTSLY